MLTTLGAVAALAVAGLLVYAATRPDTFRVSRATVIAAPAEAIFPLINDFRGWASWSPWETKDPAMKKSLSGAERGPGAAYAWEGNNDVGSGRMEITESTPQRRVVIDLSFTRPMKARNTVELALEPEAGGTRVDWVMHGPSPFMSKLFGIFVNIDRMVGKDFEAGLAKLKALAEAGR
ncbi:MAG: SRPBCC family protein [Rhodospirillaceae bacterium]|nr:SRPBCC family protein [Rhodospirillaceae bacterium]